MRRRVLLLVGAIALGTGATLAPHAPPLYDGIGFPDEPYRYAQVLADDPVKTPPPTTASATLRMTAGSNEQGIILTTAETGPQLLAFIPKGAVTAAGVPTLGIAATPRAPDQPPPKDGPIAGDIYRLATTGRAIWAKGGAGTISLRSPQGIPIAPTMEFRAAGQRAWKPLATTRVGNDIWESPLDSLGDYALVLSRGTGTTTRNSSNTSIFLLAGGVGLIAVILIGVRLGLRRRVSGDPAAG